MTAPSPQPEGAPGELPEIRAERYADFQPVGAGGMGIVYSVEDLELRRTVAFKVIRPPGDEQPESSEPPPTPLDLPPWPTEGPSAEERAEWEGRFLHEALLTASLEHPGIVPVHEIGRTHAGLPYYTMRLIRGDRTLAMEMAAYQGRDAEERLALLEPFLKLCDTLAYAHEHGLVHRDLKPSNVALGPYGEVVLLDWGLAKVIGSQDTTRRVWEEGVSSFREHAGLETMPTLIGTPGFMAPEAATMDIDRVGVRSDVYSAGTILFQMLTGTLPFTAGAGVGDYVARVAAQDAPPATAYDEDVPPELADICARALARDPAARTATAGALADDVRGWQARRAARALAAGLREEAQRLSDTGSELAGASLLRQCERAQALLDRAHEADPDAGDDGPLREKIDAHRRRAVHEEGRASRRRVLTWSGLAALVLLAVAGGIFVTILDRQKEEALEDRYAAEELTDFVLFKAGEALESSGNYAELARNVERVGEYYASAPPPHDVASAARRAKTLFPLGFHYARDGRAREAREHHENTLQMLAPFLADAPACHPIHVQHARTHLGAGLASMSGDRWAEALSSLESALAVARRVVTACKSNGGYKTAVWSLRELGALRAVSAPNRAMEHFEESLRLFGRIDRTEEKEEASRHNIPRFEATLHRDIAAAHVRGGRVEEASRALDRAHGILIAVRAGYADENKVIAPLENDLAALLIERGALRLRMGREANASADLEGAARITKSLLTTSPDFVHFVRTGLDAALVGAQAGLLAGDSALAVRRARHVAAILAGAKQTAAYPFSRAMALELEAHAAGDDAARAATLRTQAATLVRPLVIDPAASQEAKGARSAAFGDLSRVEEFVRAFAARPGADARWVRLAATLAKLQRDYLRGLGLTVPD